MKCLVAFQILSFFYSYIYQTHTTMFFEATYVPSPPLSVASDEGMYAYACPGMNRKHHVN